VVVLLIVISVLPAIGSGQETETNTKLGPFIDKLAFKVIQSADSRALALQNDEIDLIDSMVDPAFIRELEPASDIELASRLRNGYGYFTIKTDKYPFNITDFRRAIAFALDKRAISDSVWDGLSLPQDSLVPQVNPFSIEGYLPYTYYEANAELGNGLLDHAGFADVDSDGQRESPDGSELEVTVECAQSSSAAIEVGQYVVAALHNLGVDAKSKSTDFYEYLSRLFFHGDYDIVFLGAAFTNFDVDWLAYEFGSAYADKPYRNIPCWRNATYDRWGEQLLHSIDYDLVYEAAIEMQKIWIHACPEIICYENMAFSAYRTDRFEGFVNSVVDGVPSWWTNYGVHLKLSETGPFGGTLRWSNSMDVETFNFMAAMSAYSANVNQMMWDCMIRLGPDGSDVLWLAESYLIETNDENPAVPPGHTRFTFNLIQNATWSDGVPLTGEDVAFTLNFYRDAIGNPYGTDLGDLTAAYSPTTYAVIVEVSAESFWYLHTIGFKPILPKHVFQNISAAQWNEWNPAPQKDALVTSGPFAVSDYVAGEFCELKRNPKYFFRAPGESNSTVEPTLLDDPVILSGIAGVTCAVLVVIGSYVSLRLSFDPAGFVPYHVPARRTRRYSHSHA